MSVHWNPPSPVLVVDDETGAFVMTHSITSVVPATKSGSILWTGEGHGIPSPMTPKELFKRMMDIGVFIDE